ncbi:hypothetical protein [Flavobacterium limnophilum]|uniref:hypothetical protein n=1 Tax=Flavobacterium limnophilum TaxID=3003262 RepID=UPI0022ABE17B|nr:hypothetical protein [Flavobacterium limnophilum]
MKNTILLLSCLFVINVFSQDKKPLRKSSIFTTKEAEEDWVFHWKTKPCPKTN